MAATTTRELFRLYHDIDAGPDGYPAEWHKTLKHLVREQAGNRCVRCKHPYRNGEHGRGEWSPCDEQCEHDGPLRLFGGGKEIDIIPRLSGGFVAGDLYRAQSQICSVEAQWRILTTHHLDGVKLNCRWWNLAALCQKCHLTIQGRVKMHRPYFLDHSEWFKPYVAGFYAWQHLGENLDREQTMLNLDDLLSLGQSRPSP